MTAAATTTTHPLRTPHRYQAWLRQQRPDRTVGYRGLAEACPMACFLASCGIYEPQVDLHKYWDGHCWHRLPAWAARHEAALDTGGPDGSPVRAEEALQALGEHITTGEEPC
jgi:hypothetical protein